MAERKCEPMTDEELRQIRLRAIHATEGPWVCETSENGEGDIHFTVRSTASFPEHPWSPRYVAWLMGTIRDANVTHPRGKPCPTCGYYVHRHRAVQVAVDQREDQWIRDDAEFIASAREDVPALLAEVERLRTALQTEQQAHWRWEQDAAHYRDENAAMREIVEVMAVGTLAHYEDDTPYCLYCTQEYRHPAGITHTEACPVTKARALMAQRQAAEDRGQ